MSWLGSLLICSLIIPGVLAKEGGVSNFGNHWSTVAIYTLGFALNIGFIYMAGNAVLRINPKLIYIGRVLKLLSLLTFIVFLSTFPRHFSFTYSNIHDYLGIALYSYEFLISVWLVIKMPTAAAFSFLLIEATGSIIGLLSVIKVIHWLFVGQVIGAAGFGLLLVLVLPKVVEQEYL